MAEHAAPEPAPPGARSTAAPEPLLASLAALARELPGLLGERLELLTLELQRARLALVQMLALIVAAALLGVTAWLALWGVIAGLLIELGWHWAAALAAIMLLNVAAAWIALARVRALAPQLGLPATRRHLGFFSASARSAAAPTATPAAQHERG